MISDNLGENEIQCLFLRGRRGDRGEGHVKMEAKTGDRCPDNPVLPVRKLTFSSGGCGTGGEPKFAPELCS